MPQIQEHLNEIFISAETLQNTTKTNIRNKEQHLAKTLRAKMDEASTSGQFEYIVSDSAATENIYQHLAALGYGVSNIPYGQGHIIEKPDINSTRIKWDQVYSYT